MPTVDGKHYAYTAKGIKKAKKAAKKKGVSLKQEAMVKLKKKRIEEEEYPNEGVA